MWIFGPDEAPRTSALTVTPESASVPEVTVSPSTSRTAGRVTVAPTSSSTRSTSMTSPTDTFFWLPPVRTIAYTTVGLSLVVELVWRAPATFRRAHKNAMLIAPKDKITEQRLSRSNRPAALPLLAENTHHHGIVTTTVDHARLPETSFFDHTEPTSDAHHPRVPRPGGEIKTNIVGDVEDVVHPQLERLGTVSLAPRDRVIEHDAQPTPPGDLALPVPRDDSGEAVPDIDHGSTRRFRIIVDTTDRGADRRTRGVGLL